MVDFRRTKTVTTQKPFVDVAAGLPAGKHRFQLIVTDSQGNQSKPAELVVEIRERISRDRLVTPAISTSPGTLISSSTIIRR